MTKACNSHQLAAAKLPEPSNCLVNHASVLTHISSFEEQQHATCLETGLSNATTSLQNTRPSALKEALGPAKRSTASPDAPQRHGPRPIRRGRFPPSPPLSVPRRHYGQHQRLLLPRMSLLDVPPYQALEVSGTSVPSASQADALVRPSSAYKHSSSSLPVILPANHPSHGPAKRLIRPLLNDAALQRLPMSAATAAAIQLENILFSQLSSRPLPQHQHYPLWLPVIAPSASLSKVDHAQDMAWPSPTSPPLFRDRQASVVSSDDSSSPTIFVNEDQLPLAALPPTFSVESGIVNELPLPSARHKACQIGHFSCQQHFGMSPSSFDPLEQLAVTAVALEQNRKYLSHSSSDSESFGDRHVDDAVSDSSQSYGPRSPLYDHVVSPTMPALQDLTLSSFVSNQLGALPFLPPLESCAAAILGKSNGLKRTPSACAGQVPDDVVCVACREQFDDPEGFLIVHPGLVLRERYLVERILGQGTFGTVVQVLDLHLQAKLASCNKKGRVNLAQCRVAMKIIRSSPKYRIASRTEIRILEAIHQPLDAFLACLSTTDAQVAEIFQGPKYCIRMHYWFEHRHHLCMVFPLLQTDLYCYMEKSHFSPFSLFNIQQLGKQLLTAVSYLHALNIIHTDLKPENIMLLQPDEMPMSHMPMPTFSKGLKQTTFTSHISLIDFGSALLQDAYHADIVSTRHYRAPEIILELGWSFPCDCWSIGCILMELFLGHQLFKTHDVVTHLKLMEVLLGPFPDRMVHPHQYVLSNKPVSADERPPLPFFNDAGQVLFPLQDTSPTSMALVDAIQPLSSLIPASLSEGHRLFLDLTSALLTLDPAKRISSREALLHPFFSCSLSLEQDDGFPF